MSRVDQQLDLPPQCSLGTTTTGRRIRDDVLPVRVKNVLKLLKQVRRNGTGLSPMLTRSLYLKGLSPLR